MKFYLKLGKKHSKDKIILINTKGWEQVTYEDLFKLIRLFFMNENTIYPPPAQGADFLLSAISDLKDNDVDIVLDKYAITKRFISGKATFSGTDIEMD